jgi:general L-amino acid transport system permease protein
MASQEVLREEPSRGFSHQRSEGPRHILPGGGRRRAGGGVWWIAHNVIANLTRLHIASGFAFLKGRAGFDISESAIAIRRIRPMAAPSSSASSTL